MSSKQVANAALRMAITASRTEESSVKRSLGENGIKAVAVDFGGEFVSSVSKIVERAVVAAKPISPGAATATPSVTLISA